MSEKWEDLETFDYELPQQSEQTHASFDELRNLWAAERTRRIELERHVNAIPSLLEALRTALHVLDPGPYVTHSAIALRKLEAKQTILDALALYRGKSA